MECSYCAHWPNDSRAIAEDIVRNGRPMPRFYQECGTEDFTFPLNEACYRNLTAIGYDITYVKRPGTHNWEFWDAALRNFLDWTGLRKLAPGDRPGLLVPKAWEPADHPAIDVRAVLESPSCHGSLDCEFILPAETEDDPWKEAYLMIHPAEDDYTYWQRKRDLEAMAEENHVAIVCPQLYDSLGKDQEHGRPFGVFLTQEVPFFLSYLFGQNRKLQTQVRDRL